jgi:hypothetical protein
MEGFMAESKAGRNRPGGARSEPKNVTTDLIPANPLTARQALIQVTLLAGIPLLLLLLFRFILHRFFPELGY